MNNKTLMMSIGVFLLLSYKVLKAMKYFMVD